MNADPAALADVVLAIPARARQAWRWVVWLVPLILVVVAWLVARALLVRPREQEQADFPTEAVRAVTTKLAVANAQAAVEVAVARTGEQAVASELRDIQKVSDTRARLARLVALRQRVEAARQR